MTIQLGDASANPFLTDVVSQAQTVGALNAAVTLQLRGQSTCTVQVTTIGSQTLVWEGTTDGVNWYALTVFPIGGFTGAPATSTTTTGQWVFVCAGMYQVRTRCSAYTSGSATVSMVASQGTNEQQVTTGIGQGATTAGQLNQLVAGAVTTAAPTYTTAQTNPISLTTGGGLRGDLASQAGTAITAVPVAVGTGAPSGNAPVVNAAVFGGVSPAGGARAATAPTGAIQLGAIGQNTNPTSVTSGQMVGVAADLSGRIITTPLNYRTLISHAGATVSVATISTLLAAGAAGVFRDITMLVVTTAGAAAQTLTITDGTVSFILDYPNAALAPGAPLIIPFTDVPLRATTAATAWQVTQSAATTCHYLVQYVERIA